MKQPYARCSELERLRLDAGRPSWAEVADAIGVERNELLRKLNGHRRMRPTSRPASCATSSAGRTQDSATRRN
jgi:hypothetical protein